MLVEDFDVERLQRKKKVKQLLRHGPKQLSLKI